MTDKEILDAIKAEIERRMDELYNKLPDGNDVINGAVTIPDANITGKYTALESILHFIKTLQEEPVKQSVDEAMAEIERKAKLFTEANKGKTSEGILAEMRGEEPVSKDLKTELEKYIKDHFTIDTEQLDRFGIEERDYMYSMDKRDMLALIKHFINWHKTKEEPVSDDLEEACEQLAENARKHKAETSSPFFSPIDYKQGVIDGAAWQKQKDSIVSEGLEEAMQHNAPNNIGIDDLLYWRNGFITGSKWQKEQLIKNAIFGEWFRCGIVLPSEYNADNVKKVKLIIVKED